MDITQLPTFDVEQGVQEGCQTFDDVLFNRYKDGKSSRDQAPANAGSANNLRLTIKLAGLKADDSPAAGGDQSEAEKPKGFQIQGVGVPLSKP